MQTPRKVAKFIPPCGVLRRVVYLHFVALLGCVIWLQKNSMVLFFGTPFVPLSIADVDGKRRWTCLSPLKVDEFSASRQQREAQGSPKGRDSRGDLFLLLLLGKQKKKAVQTYFCFNCSFSLLAQRKRTSSEAAKEKAAPYLSAFGGFPVLLIKSERFGKSFHFAESVFTLYCAARLRETAGKTKKL